MKKELCMNNRNGCGNCLSCSKISDVQFLATRIEAMRREELERETLHIAHACSQLNTILELSTNPLFITDGDGVVIRVNAAYEKLSGVKREEILGKNVRELVGVTLSRSSTLEAIKTGKNVTFEQYLLKSGRTGITTSIPVFKDGKLEMVIGCNFDPDSVEDMQAELAKEKKKAKKYQEELEHFKSLENSRHKIIAQDKKTLEMLTRAERVAAVDSSVLIVGENGTGKEEFAKFIHGCSMRRDGPLITVNCGAIPANLFESELFGYEKGAFTGASAAGKTGLFEAANGGTIFLDEIGELPLDMQVKLLRVLQERVVRKVGGNKNIPIDVRVLAATNRNLQQMMNENLFRMDLYYRLSVVILEIPPLRERTGDIVPLSAHFVEELNKRYHMKKTLSRSAYQALKEYSWPGNVRELKNILEEAVVMSDNNRITRGDLILTKAGGFDEFPLEGISLEQVLEETEYQYLCQAMEYAGSIRKAAAYLNMPPTTYARRLKQLQQKYGD